MARIVAVCLSRERAAKKEPIEQGILKRNHGLAGDAHAGSSHRQVSLLAMESIIRARREGLDINPGGSAENLITEGIDLASLPIGSRLRIGKNIILELTQIGKEQHRPEFTLLPKEGVFARVIRGGAVRADDELQINQDNRE